MVVYARKRIAEKTEAAGIVESAIQQLKRNNVQAIHLIRCAAHQNTRDAAAIVGVWYSIF